MCFLFVSAWDLLITQKPVYSRRYTVYQAKYITNNPADDYSLYSHENAASIFFFTYFHFLFILISDARNINILLLKLSFPAPMIVLHQ